MDEFTHKHLEAWLEAAYNDHERDEPRAAMTAIYESDPEYWGKHTWTECRDAAEARA